MPANFSAAAVLNINGTVRTELFNVCLAYLQRSVAPLRCHFCIRLFINLQDGTATEVNISEVQDAEAIHITYSSYIIEYYKCN